MELPHDLTLDEPLDDGDEGAFLGFDSYAQPEPDELEEIQLSDEEVKKATPRITRDQNVMLARRVERGDVRAKEEMLQANLGLVYAWANKLSGLGADRDDLEQEGLIGLLKAIEGYDWRTGYAFSTYANPAIKGHMLEAINRRGALIKVPKKIADSQRLVRDVEDELAQKLGRQPTIDELVAKTQISADEVVEALNVLEAKASLDTPVGLAEGSATMSELIADENAEEGSKHVDALGQKEELERCLFILTPRQAAVMERLLGLNGFSPMTPLQIRDELGISRERVRQLKDRSIEKIHAYLNPPPVEVFEPPHKWQDLIDGLPFEQIEMLEMTYRGFDNSRIASELGVTAPDVRHMRTELAAKFDMSEDELMQAAPEILTLAGEIIED